MNDIIAQLDATCVIILKLALAFVMLAFGRFLLSLGRPQTTVWANMPSVTTGSAGDGYHLRWEPVANRTEPEPVKVLAAPQPLPEPTLECGNCHHEIKAKPSRTVSEGGKTAQYYVCEHCGMTVRSEA